MLGWGPARGPKPKNLQAKLAKQGAHGAKKGVYVTGW
tara:strand:+ start:225 stop:335 length:111 start_codon:yes stop_codon:yes gene_type:complete